MTNKPKINVIVDSREKTPWTFHNHDLINIILVEKLDTGDYAIQGMEDLLCIERKKSVAELAHNVIEKRFAREVERMLDYPHRFLLLEFDVEAVKNYPYGSDIPKHIQKNIKITGNFILSYLSNLQINNNIHVVFCSNEDGAQDIAVNLMKKVLNGHRNI